MRARYGMSFVSLMFDLHSAIAIAVLNVISSQILSRYNGTQLYDLFEDSNPTTLELGWTISKESTLSNQF